MPRRRADQSRRTFSAKRSTCHHPPGIKNCQSASYAEIGSDGSGSHSYAKPTPTSTARPRPTPVQHTLGCQLCGQLAAGRNVPPTPRRHRETVRAATTPRHRHHLPGSRNSKSESYAEISTNRLRTRLRTWCTSFARVVTSCSDATRHSSWRAAGSFASLRSVPYKWQRGGRLVSF